MVFPKPSLITLGSSLLLLFGTPCLGASQTVGQMLGAKALSIESLLKPVRKVQGTRRGSIGSKKHQSLSLSGVLGQDSKPLADWFEAAEKLPIGVEKPSFQRPPSALSLARAPDSIPSVAIAATPDRSKSAPAGAALSARAGAAVLFVSVAGVVADIIPASLYIGALGQGVEVEIAKASASDQVKIFVRDPMLLKFDPALNRLTALKAGKTEVYVIANHRMLIVPVTVAGELAAIADALAVPEGLISLEGNMGSTAGSALDISAPEPAAVEPDLEAPLPVPNRAAYSIATQTSGYKSLTFRLMDTRSGYDLAQVYPASDLSVSILGTEFRGKSDASGQLQVTEIPSASRFMVQVQDDQGRYRPTSVEVFATPKNGRQTIPLRVITHQSFDAITQAVGLTQRADLASFCGTLLNNEKQPSPLSGHQTSLNVEAQGPYYFAEGLPVTNLDATTSNGHFCYFNINPGLVQLGVFADGAMIGALALPLLPGSHLDDNFPIGTAPALRTRLAVLPSAHEQLYGDSPELHLGSFDSVSLSPLGWGSSMDSLTEGLMGADAGASMYHGRLYGFVEAAEFEPTIYSYSADELRTQALTPLIPRGFGEDVFNELSVVDGQDSIAYDPALGTIIVFHGQGQEAIGKSAHIRVVNAYGQELNGGWFFGSEAAGLVKAVFFNVEPGLYSIIVENDRHFWLAADTTYVDAWTTSLVQTGAKIARH